MNHFSNMLGASSLILMALVPTTATAEPLTPVSVLQATEASDWRQPNQADLLYLQLESGEVVFELATEFAPNHIENLKKLVAARYFDGLAIIRSQDNYVVQWGDPQAGTDKARSQAGAASQLEPEFFRPRKGLDFNSIKSRDAYANTVGFVRGFAAGADSNSRAKGRAWLTHCYGALGVGRNMAANSGNSAELYVVTGHAPRHLDRNVTLIGRALSGMQYLSSLPRGSGAMGFYESPEEATRIRSVRLGSDLPKELQTQLEVLRTDTPSFKKYVQSRTVRQDEWFLDPAGKIEVCNVGVPVREAG